MPICSVFIRKACVLALFLSLSMGVYAQRHTLQGVVLHGETGESLDYVSVVATKDSTGNEFLGFAYTDANGHFSFDVETQSEWVWLHVRLMSFSTLQQKLALPTSDLKLSLQPVHQEVEEVFVKAQRREMRMLGDTISFDSESFRLGDERSLKDVVRRMPGMDVDEEGNVSYQGKRVSEVLIDGQNLATSSSIALNTLPADYSKSIELYQNYTQDKLTEQFSGSDRMALNITSAKKTSFVGRVEAGGGIMSKYSGNGTGVLKLQPLSLFLNLSGNNVGQSALSSQEYMMSKMQLEDDILGGGLSLRLSEDEYRMLYPPENEYARHNAVSSVASNWQPNQKYSLRSSLMYAHTDAKGAEEGLYEYFVGTQSLRTFQEEDQRRKHGFLNLEIQQKWTPTPLWILKANTNLGGRLAYSDKHGEILSEMAVPADSIRAQTEQKNRTALLGQSLYIHRQAFERGLFSIAISGDVQNVRTQLGIGTNVNLLPLRFLSAAGEEYPFHFAQQTLRLDCRFSGRTSLTYPLIGNTYGRITAGIELVNSRLDLLLPSESNEALRYLASDLTVLMFRNRGFFRYRLSVTMRLYDMLQRQNPIATPPRKFNLEPALNLGLHFSGLHQLQFGGSFQTLPASMHHLWAHERISSYKSFQTPSQVTDLLQRRLLVTSHYVYGDPFYRLFLLVSGYYNRTHNTPIFAIESSAFADSGHYEGGGLQEMYNASLRLSKGIPRVPIDFKLEASYADILTPYKRNGIVSRLKNQTAKCFASLLSRFSPSPLNFEVSGHYQHGWHTFGGKTQEMLTNQEWSVEAKILLNFKSLNLSISAYRSEIVD